MQVRTRWVATVSAVLLTAATFTGATSEMSLQPPSFHLPTAHQKTQAKKHLLPTIPPVKKNQSPEKRYKHIRKPLWNLHQVDLYTFIQEVSELTHKNFVVSPEVKGKVTLISGRALPTKAIYPTFLTILRLNGYTAVKSGHLIKILPQDQAVKSAPPFHSKTQSADALTLGVIPTKDVSAIALMSALRGLLPEVAHMAPVPDANVLIVAASQQTIQRIQEMVEKIDKKNTHHVEVFTLKHASASDVANNLNKLLSNERRGFYDKLVISADDRSNRLLVSGDLNHRLRIRAIIAQLDVATHDLGNTEVVYLKYQKAEDLVPVLSSVVKAYYAMKKGKPSQQPLERILKPPKNSSHALFKEKEAFLSQPENTETPRTTVMSEGIQSEPHTNALVITAPPDLMHTLKAVIAKLDIRRAQVLVEAIIAEISDKSDQGFGVEWQNVTKTGPFGSITSGSKGVLDTLQGASGLNALTGIGGGLALGFIHQGSIQALLHALNSSANVNILATPSVVALDNQQALIRVVRTVPFDVGQYETQNPTSSVSPYITTEYRPVGLRLQFTPQITQDNAIQLKIAQQTGSVEQGSQPGKPTTNDRAIDTTVMVDDGDILVLGGLIDTEVQDQTSKVPLLGDLPAVGGLFRSASHHIEKRNLMIFIRPVILRDRKTGITVTQSKYQFMQNQQILKRHQHDVILKPPILRPWHQDTTYSLPKPF